MEPDVLNVNIVPKKSTNAPAARSYHHGNLREALVAEGLAVLAESGQSGLSVRELARRIGVSPNAAYRHFRDKNGLLSALAAEGFRRLSAANAAAAAEVAPGDAVAALRAFGSAYVRSARENPGLFRLMFDCLALPGGSEELAAAGDATFEALRTAVAGAARIPADSERTKAGALFAWSLVHGLSHLILDGQIEGDPDKAVDAVLDLGAENLSDGRLD